MPLLRRLFALAPAAPLVCAGLFACAQSEPADLTPYVDPTLPTVGSDGDPIPGKGTQSGTASSSGSSGSSGESSSGSSGESSSGASGTAAKDAGSDTGTQSQPPPTTPKPSQGEIVISEVMYDTTLGEEPASEWIEIHNLASSARSLSGLTLLDGGNRTHTIGANVTIAAGAYKVLVRNQTAAVAAKVPAGVILYEYGTGLSDLQGIQLANSSTGAVFVKDGSTIIARADYGGWFTQSGGSSLQLKTSTYAASADKTGWCLSGTAWAAGADRGTPGSACDCP